MDKIDLQELGIVTSSPKKRVKRGKKVPKLGRSLAPKIDKHNTDNNNIALNDFNFDFPGISIPDNDGTAITELGLEKSTRLSPIPSFIQSLKEDDNDYNINEDNNNYDDSKKVTSFENMTSSYSQKSGTTNRMQEEDARKSSDTEEVINDSVNSGKSEAEVTIEKIKEFIETKRKALKHKGSSPIKLAIKESLASQPTAQVNPSSISSIKSSSKVKKGKVTKTTKHTTKVKDNKNVDKFKTLHQKNLRRLIDAIDNSPYESKWTIREWQLFQQYLNEWKVSGDDEMFEPEILEELFNCKFSDMEVRVASLKTFLLWKKGKQQQGHE